MVSLTDLENQLLQLPVQQRATLAAHLLDSLPPFLSDEDEGLAEAESRDQELQSDPSRGITLERFRAYFEE